MRSDAARNREAILTSAIGVLADDPRASMGAVAAASRISRPTLYRHFPDRAAVIGAILDRVLAEADGLVTAALAADGAGGEPVAAVADLCAELAGLGDRYRFLEQAGGADIDGTRKRRARNPELVDFLGQGQRAGGVRSDLDVSWLVDAITALITQAARLPGGEGSPAGDQLRETVRAILEPPGDRSS